MTARANEAEEAQEELVKGALREAGFIEVDPRVINTLRTTPAPGQFCGESMPGTRKADVDVVSPGIDFEERRRSPRIEILLDALSDGMS